MCLVFVEVVRQYELFQPVLTGHRMLYINAIGSWYFYLYQKLYARRSRVDVSRPTYNLSDTPRRLTRHLTAY
jgi:hypothetical protein